MLDKTSQALLEEVLARLNDTLAQGDIEGVVALFQADCYWRDLVSFTWNIRTMEGQDQVRDMLQSQLADLQFQSIQADPNEVATGDEALVEGWIQFETASARGSGHIRWELNMVLNPDDVLGRKNANRKAKHWVMTSSPIASSLAGGRVVLRWGLGFVT